MNEIKWPTDPDELAYTQAYVYAYAIVDHYRILYEDMNGSPNRTLNQLVGEARFYSSEDTSILSPNNDTPYSRGYLDLRQGWVSLEIPDSAELNNRYLSFQCVDCFTNNTSYISDVKDDVLDNEGNVVVKGKSSGVKTGNFLFYKGQRPTVADNYTAAFKFDSDFVFLIGRTQMFEYNDPAAMEAEVATVQSLMNSYKIQSEYPTSELDLLNPDALETSDINAITFFTIFADALRYEQVDPILWEGQYLASNSRYWS